MAIDNSRAMAALMAAVDSMAGGAFGLEAFAVAARVAEALEDFKAANLREANEQFAAMPPAERKRPHYGANFKPYSRPAQYEWPESVAAAEKALKDAQAKAKADGAAKLVKRTFDFAADRLFSVQVLEEVPTAAVDAADILKSAMVDYKIKTKAEVANG